MSHPGTTQGPAASAQPVARPQVPRGAILAIACVANFMVIIDTSIVNVALPAMKAALGLSAADQQWVIDAYLITFGGFLLLAARAGDLFGRKGVFQAGLVVFTAASLAGGLARDPGLLIGARVLQGIGAAALASSSLSLITASHPEGPARTRALALWAMTGSSAGAVGVVLGGLLTTELSWRYVLFINIPIGVALLIAAAASLVPSPPRRDWARLDLPGALTVTMGVGSLVYAVSQATINGWGSAPVIAALAAAAVLLAAAGLIEARSAAPLVPLGIFRQRSLAVGNAVMACLGVVMTSGFFFLSLYLQQILGYSALRTGVAIVPMTVLLAGGPLAARRLIPRFGPRFPLLAGGILTTGGMAWISQLPDHSDYPTHILGPMLVIGTGIGLMLLPLVAAATAGVEPRYAGLASGLFNTARQLGGAIGLAVLVTIAATATRHSHLASPAAATVHGYRIALLVGTAVSLASVLIALLLPTPARTGGYPAGRARRIRGMAGSAHLATDASRPANSGSVT
jgi:EmrB/QacA subfamily drug resistance transporter